MYEEITIKNTPEGPSIVYTGNMSNVLMLEAMGIVAARMVLYSDLERGEKVLITSYQQEAAKRGMLEK